MQTATTMRRRLSHLHALLSVLLLSVPNLGYAEEPGRVLEKVDVSRGICVILGDATGTLTSRLAGDTELSIYVQLTSAEQVARLRQRMDAAGLLGRRVWIERGDPSRVHLADNIADVLIAAGDSTDVARGEALRVLRPQGRAL
ncbi:MAG: class I SAM-dependent methyltransferase, partial [Planctomycetota bacterium]